MKKQNFLCLEFHNADGDTVKELSKCPARPEDVAAAMQFLGLGCDIVVSVQECEVSDDGTIKTPFSYE